MPGETPRPQAFWGTGLTWRSLATAFHQRQRRARVSVAILLCVPHVDTLYVCALYCLHLSSNLILLFFDLFLKCCCCRSTCGYVTSTRVIVLFVHAGFFSPPPYLYYMCVRQALLHSECRGGRAEGSIASRAGGEGGVGEGESCGESKLRTTKPPPHLISLVGLVCFATTPVYGRISSVFCCSPVPYFRGRHLTAKRGRPKAVHLSIRYTKTAVQHRHHLASCLPPPPPPQQIGAGGFPTGGRGVPREGGATRGGGRGVAGEGGQRTTRQGRGRSGARAPPRNAQVGLRIHMLGGGEL